MAALTWLPANLFYGPPPQRRTDDPGDGFEIAARQIVEVTHYNMLSDVYDRMNRFINEERYQTISELRTILHRTRRLNESNPEPFAFNPNDWIVTSEGKFAIRDHDEIIRHDELRKREQTDSFYDYESYNGLREFCMAAHMAIFNIH